MLSVRLVAVAASCNVAALAAEPVNVTRSAVKPLILSTASGSTAMRLPSVMALKAPCCAGSPGLMIVIVAKSACATVPAAKRAVISSFDVPSQKPIAIA